MSLKLVPDLPEKAKMPAGLAISEDEKLPFARVYNDQTKVYLFSLAYCNGEWRWPSGEPFSDQFLQSFFLAKDWLTLNSSKPSPSPRPVPVPRLRILPLDIEQ